MTGRSVAVAIALGVAQGVFEWLPISSEGNITLLLTLLGTSSEVAVQLALFLHLGTAMAATGYYRAELMEVVRLLPHWRSSIAFEGDQSVVSFLGTATLVSGLVGIASYITLIEIVTELTGGLIVTLIGALLILTGVFQRLAETVAINTRELPGLVDGILVGIGQGVAILPGVSRSGTTVGILLLRGHDGESAFRLSFLLSIPAALGAGGLAMIDAGGFPGISPLMALIAMLTSGVVGYVAIDALIRLVRRIPFWAVCSGLGGLAVVGGGLLLIT